MINEEVIVEIVTEKEETCIALQIKGSYLEKGYTKYIGKTKSGKIIFFFPTQIISFSK